MTDLTVQIGLYEGSVRLSASPDVTMAPRSVTSTGSKASNENWRQKFAIAAYLHYKVEFRVYGGLPASKTSAAYHNPRLCPRDR